MTGMTRASLDIPTLLRSAREQARLGSGSVLDVLLRVPGVDAGQLVQALHDQAGVDAVFGADGLTPDFSRIDRDLARQWQCAPLLDEHGGMSIAAADPWDVALVQKAVRRLGVQPKVLAVPRTLLASWLGDATVKADASEPVSQDAITANGPVVAFVDQALKGGYANGASDVH